MSSSGKHHDNPDLLVIGLGQSGTAALGAAHADGADAIGVERSRVPPDGGLPSCEYDTRIWGIFTDGTVVCSSPSGASYCRPGAVILATGAIDIPLPVPGWHLPGVTGAWDAARFLGDGADVVVLRGPHAGADHCRPDLSQFNILHDEQLSAGKPVEIFGTHAVENIRIGDATIATRHVLLDNGLQTENTLARMAGIPTTFAPSNGGDVVVPGALYAVGGTLISVIGDAAGVGCEPNAMIHEAVDTARLLTESLNGGDIPRSIPSSRGEWNHEGSPTLPAQTTPDTLVCPEEGVTVGQVRDAIERGATTVNDVKRRTRAAMAACQGRDCLWTIRALLAEYERSYSTPMTARPPVVGITLGDLAALGRA